MRKTILVSFISLSGLLMSCVDNSEKKVETLQDASMEANTASSSIGKEPYCFKNETAYKTEDGTHLVDVEILEFTIEGDAVQGKFEWIPGEKGGMAGKISGTKKGNVIDAVYNENYSEEPYPISVKITLSPDEAVLTSSDESFGSYTIKKSDCK